MSADVSVGPEEFYPDDDCSTDERVGGDPAGRCALIETCTLRCHIRWLEGESQLNDSFIDFAGSSSGATR